MNNNKNMLPSPENAHTRAPVQIKYIGSPRPHDTVGQASRVFLAAMAGQVVRLDKPAIRAHYEAQLAELHGESMGRTC